jgi:hypothetical protein
LVDNLTAIGRLNDLELGSPLGIELKEMHHTHVAMTDPCSAKDDAKVDECPVCSLCQWNGTIAPPNDVVDSLIVAIDETIKHLTLRVARGTVRKLLEDNPEGGVKTLLDIILASQTDKLPVVLTTEVVERIREILRDANLESRELPIRDLLGDLVAVEEDDIDVLMRRIEDRLRSAFKQAKADTDGKMRIRFNLKGI